MKVSFLENPETKPEASSEQKKEKNPQTILQRILFARPGRF
jgi:hypothetical protein